MRKRAATVVLGLGMMLGAVGGAWAGGASRPVPVNVVTTCACSLTQKGQCKTGQTATCSLDASGKCTIVTCTPSTDSPVVK
jgi:hypothetical protein